MMDEDCAIGRWEQRLALLTDREALDSYGGNGLVDSGGGEEDDG